MKRFVILALAAIFYSCGEDEEPLRTNENLSQLLTSGQWKISLFEDDGIDETSDFEGINFNFLNTGRVEAFRGTQLLDEGVWSTSVDDGRVEFELSFSSNSPFDELSDDWYQSQIINSRVTFREDDNETEDRLILEKL